MTNTEHRIRNVELDSDTSSFLIQCSVFGVLNHLNLQHLRSLFGYFIPVLVMHGTDDSITSASASEAFSKSSARYSTLKLWPGMRHETHNELGKEEVLDYVSQCPGSHLRQGLWFV